MKSACDPSGDLVQSREFSKMLKKTLNAYQIRSLPALTHCFPRSFTFYVVHPIRSIHSKSRLI
jgi:hypothetical protein